MVTLLFAVLSISILDLTVNPAPEMFSGNHFALILFLNYYYK